MTFNNSKIQYRIALDIKTQIFMAIDNMDESVVGYGITIEQAIDELKKII